jgi:hypothetical protein
MELTYIISKNLDNEINKIEIGIFQEKNIDRFKNIILCLDEEIFPDNINGYNINIITNEIIKNEIITNNNSSYIVSCLDENDILSKLRDVIKEIKPISFISLNDFQILKKRINYYNWDIDSLFDRIDLYNLIYYIDDCKLEKYNLENIYRYYCGTDLSDNKLMSLYKLYKLLHMKGYVPKLLENSKGIYSYDGEYLDIENLTKFLNLQGGYIFYANEALNRIDWDLSYNYNNIQKIRYDKWGKIWLACTHRYEPEQRYHQCVSKVIDDILHIVYKKIIRDYNPISIEKKELEKRNWIYCQRILKCDTRLYDDIIDNIELYTN